MFYDSKHVQAYFPQFGAAAQAQTPCSAPSGRARLSRLMGSLRRPPLPLRRRLLGAVLGAVPVAALAAALGAPGQGRAAADPAPASLERRIKAEFLYKFLGYTEFPATAFASAGAPFVIGVLGADELAAELSRIVAGRSVQARAITVKILREHDAPAGVHLLFVGGADSARVRSALKAGQNAGQNAPLLLVSESEHGLQHGSVINFKIVEERVRFDVSLEAADKHSVKLSSRLLTVANHVHKGAP